MPIKSLLVLFSYHHNNTEKIANVFAKVLDAEIKTPQQTDPEELQEYGLIGFGSGIYDEKHQKSLLDLADKLSQVTDGKAFIFSTSSNLEPRITRRSGRNCGLKVTRSSMNLLVRVSTQTVSSNYSGE